MKSLSRILAHYLLYAVLILLATLCLNVVSYILCGFRIVRATNHASWNIRDIASCLEETDEGVALSEKGIADLEGGYVWAMLLDDGGNIVWDWQLPDGLRHPYTVCEAASFSRWYLDGYPVREWVTDQGLFVAAEERGSMWKYNVSERTEVIKFVAFMFPATLFANLFLAFMMVLFLGFRSYRSLCVVAAGIEQLSEGKAVRLPEKGMTQLLARQLNQTSGILVRQQERLSRRDDARAEWISGVSHDIRTPLSLIMGYAADLKEDPSLSMEQRRLAGRMEAQSLQIKRLIEDLNLASKLEYSMQPLRVAEFSPAGLLRSVVSSQYNQGLGQKHEIDLYIDPDVEKITLSGDTALLARAFSNLLQNSICHNPQGCLATVTAYPAKAGVCFQFSDDGAGIPEAVVRSLEGKLLKTEKAPHVMGLRIVQQICKAHGWRMVFTDSHTVHILAEGRVKGVNPRKTPTSTAV